MVKTVVFKMRQWAQGPQVEEIHSGPVCPREDIQGTFTEERTFGSGLGLHQGMGRKTTSERGGAAANMWRYLASGKPLEALELPGSLRII